MPGKGSLIPEDAETELPDPYDPPCLEIPGYAGARW